jgi:DNA polymerase-3 subunit delta
MTEKATPTFYLLYGDEDMARTDAVKKIRASMGSSTEADLNISEYDGESASVHEILNAARSFPFLADKRLVIVRGLIAHLTRKGAGEAAKKDMETLLETLPNLPNYARLVLVERENLRKDSKLVKLASSHEKGYCKHFEAPKDSTDWILKRAKNEYNATMELDAARALASVTGSDLRRADNELVKLVSYVEGERPINEKDVILLTPYVAEANVFDMVDALATGNGARALTLLNTSLEQDPSDPGFGLLALITRQFRLLLLTREHLASGGSAVGSAIAEAIGINSSWQAEKLSKQSRAFSVSELEKVYRRLQKYDQDIKTGRIEIRLALDLFIASMTTK